MLLELLENLLTPCSRQVRIMGYLREVVGIGARYRRCKSAWEPHLDRCRDLIRHAITVCPVRRRAVVLGSGRLYDVPLEELAAAFTQVVLVDLVHPLPARWRSRRLSHVQRVTADVTGVLDALQTVAYSGGTLPKSAPSLFQHDHDVDLVISLNLLSQLPIIPCRYLRRWNRFTEDALESFGLQLMQAHVEYLQSFRCTKCLLADVAFLSVDALGHVIEETDALPGITLPWPGEEWVWQLAPGGENRGKGGNYHRVRGMIAQA
jgi:hypothetical protein